MQWLKTGTEPKEESLFLGRPEAKIYCVNREAFVLGSEGFLVREKTDKYPKRLVVPELCRTEILELSHDITAARHQGVQRTTNLVKGTLLENFRS